MDEDIWSIERRLWTEGARAFEALLADAAVMALPGGAGIMDRAVAIESIRHAPRWTKVAMSDRIEARPGEDRLAIACRVAAQRGDEAPYRALCTSSYARSSGGWRLFQHQQTPEG